MDKTEHERVGPTGPTAASATQLPAEDPWTDPGHAGYARGPAGQAPESSHPAYETVRLLRRLMAEVAPTRLEAAASPTARPRARGPAREAPLEAPQDAAVEPDAAALTALERRMQSLCARLAELERTAAPPPPLPELSALVPLQALVGAISVEVGRLRQPAVPVEATVPAAAGPAEVTMPAAGASAAAPADVPAPAAALLSVVSPVAPEAPPQRTARRGAIGIWIALGALALVLGAVVLDQVVRAIPPAVGPAQPAPPQSSVVASPPLPAASSTYPAAPPARLVRPAAPVAPATAAGPKPDASPTPVAAGPGRTPPLPAVLGPAAPTPDPGAGSPAPAAAPPQLAVSPAPAPAPAPGVVVVDGPGPAARDQARPSGPGIAPTPNAPGPRAPAAAIPTGSSAAGPAATAPAPVVVRAIADAWIQVLDRSGTVVFSRVLHAGDSWTPPGPGLFLTTGNAGGTELVVNGVAGRPLGAAGAVLHQIPLDPARPASGRRPVASSG
jgi:RodZ C-terminal domain